MAVWFIERNGEVVGVVTRPSPDTYEMRKESTEYPDSTVWLFTTAGWWYMPTSGLVAGIWEEGDPPDSVKLAQMLRE